MTFLCLLAAGIAAPPSLIPLPNSVDWRPGFCRFTRDTVLVNEGANRQSAARLREAVSLPLDSVAGGASRIVLRKVSGYDHEAYKLTVTSEQVEIDATTDAGLYYGIQTLRQLDQGGEVRECRIEDAPRFPWRGLLLDESRHFFGPKFIHKFIDVMSAYKLNTLHWHLTDDGGWRMQTHSYPELTSIGAWRKEQGVEWDYGNLWFPGHKPGVKLYGGYYTQRELKEIVRYAQERNVTIVPEIEMPGHSLAATASDPDLQCEPPLSAMAAYLKDSGSQSPSMICPGKDSTIEHYKRVLDETMEIFPSKFIHIGGDEVDKTLWHQCKYCQARMKANGLKDENELQSWFVRQMDAYIASKGRRLIGWDEILEGGLAPGAAVMSWRGTEGGIAAARAGHDVVMCPTSHCYFDAGYDGTPTSLVYSYEPVPAELQGVDRERVLGAQGNLWTEHMSNGQKVESMAYPRALALAEGCWTQPEHKNWADFSNRLNGQYPQLEQMGVAFQLGAPTLQPDVLNRAIATEWTVSQPPVRGAQIVDSSGRVLAGDRVTAGSSDLKLYFAMPDGRRGPAAIGRVVNLHPNDAPPSLGLKRSFMLWTGQAAPPLSAFGGATTDIAPLVRLAGVPVEKPFALLFAGVLIVTQPGRYTLILGSDDGSNLYLDGQLILENDGTHGYRERTATIDLEPGAYRLQISYFDAGGAQSVSLSWIPPRRAREVVTFLKH